MSIMEKSQRAHSNDETYLDELSEIRFTRPFWQLGLIIFLIIVASLGIVGFFLYLAHSFADAYVNAIEMSKHLQR